MRHFGEPLVDSVFDFGLRAPEPEQVLVLDHLADEFVKSGWSFRHLHRLIVTSETYQLSSSSLHADEITIAADPSNQNYWRMNTRRMDAQTVRDTLLSLSGKLDLTIGGPSVAVTSNANRRSIYFRHSRDDQNQFLKMFDDADLLQCYRRSESVVPQQALALSNSRLAFESAGEIAKRIESSLNASERADEKKFIKRSFQFLLARDAAEDEVAECLRYFSQWEDLEKDSGGKASLSRRAGFVHALLNHNDMISIR